MKEKNDAPCEHKCSNTSSIEVMYNESIRLYNLEMDSYGAVANKINGILLINGTIIALVTAALVQLISYEFALNSYIFGFLLSITYLLLAVSIFSSAYAYLTKELPTVSAKKLFKNYYCKDKNEILDKLSCKIIKDTEKINKITKNTSKDYKISLILMICGVICFVILIVLSLFSYRHII